MSRNPRHPAHRAARAWEAYVAQGIQDLVAWLEYETDLAGQEFDERYFDDDEDDWP